MKELCRCEGWVERRTYAHAAIFEDGETWYAFLHLHHPEDGLPGWESFTMNVLQKNSVRLSDTCSFYDTVPTSVELKIRREEPLQPRWNRVLEDPLAVIMELLL